MSLPRSTSSFAKRGAVGGATLGGELAPKLLQVVGGQQARRDERFTELIDRRRHENPIERMDLA